MQNLHAIPGGSTGRLFGVSGGGTAGGSGGAAPGGVAAAAAVAQLDRRLRPHLQQNLRCPRCDSLNTKFCYYNNYNLSQPRHFCKSCRRYWTKGGVLRNVPVGGGCRKSKRSSASSSSSSSSSSPSKMSKSSSNGCKDSRREPPAAPPAAASSSDSSSLTANATDAPTVTEEPASPPPPATLDSYATALLDNINEGEAVPASPAAAAVFPEIGSFTSLIAAAANPDLMGPNFTAGAPQLHLLPVHSPKAALPQMRTGLVEDEIRMPGIPAADWYMDQIAHMDVFPPPTQARQAPGPALTTVDWPGCVDTSAGLFDAAGTSIAGDYGGYWNQSQWGEIDPSVFLP